MPGWPCERSERWSAAVRGGGAVWIVGGRSGERGWREAAGGVVGARERLAGWQAGGQAQDDLAGVVDDAGGHAEQHAAHELGLAAAREMPGRLGPEHQVVEQREQVQRERGAGQPEAIGVQVAQRQAAQRDAELLVLDALLDLRALALVALDRGGVAGQVGEDEAVAVDGVGLAGQPERELLARDRLAPPR